MENKENKSEFKRMAFRLLSSVIFMVFFLLIKDCSKDGFESAVIIGMSTIISLLLFRVKENGK